jgi:hypothetical protein
LGYDGAVRTPTAIVLSALVLSCVEAFPTGGEENFGPLACGDDLDCTGDRICVEGACVPDKRGAIGEDCVAASASCGCEGKGFAGALTYLAYRTCDGAEAVEVTRSGSGGWVSWRAPGDNCSGPMETCELGGLARLLDEAFTGCPADEPARPCAVPGATGSFLACRTVQAEERCILLPAVGGCGEGALLAGLEEIRARVRAEPDGLCY